MGRAEAATSSVGGYGVGWRHVQVGIMFVAACFAITMRVCLSVAVVDMTGPDTGDGQQRFNWDPTEKSAVLGSFLWGYMCTQVVGGALSARGRASLMLAGALGFSGLLTAALPFVATSGGALAVAASRVGCGIIQGVLYPSSYTLLGRWVPPDERSRGGSLLLASQPLGNILAMGMSGWLATSWGWPSIFYVFGLSGVVIAALILLVSADSPHTHPRISQAERDFILKAISAGSTQRPRLAVPWGAMLTSRAVLVALVAHVGYLWGYWVVVACTPSFFNNLLDVGLEWNGLLSAAPHVSTLVCSFLFGWLGDVFEARRLMSRTVNRKLFNTIGQCGPGLLCVVIAALGTANPYISVALLVVAGGLMSGCYNGGLITFVDIAPNFSGICFGMGNTIGSFISAFAPYAEGAFVDRNDPMPGWSKVFYLTAAVYLLLNLAFCIWGTAELQTWNDPSANTSRPSALKSYGGLETKDRPLTDLRCTTDNGCSNRAFEEKD